ncbi:TIGR03086 family metal-binding protein [Streptomyces sp. NPDC001262]|uniref:TIGR03086 family metal-binding protein n=1 Tax=Streptomyces sp. NPDC001262 TaxID=3364552 RepID=UPI0036BDBB1B
MNTTSDPRVLSARATGQLAALIAAVPAERLGDPTPCEEFDIRGLLAHLVGGLNAGAAIGETGKPERLTAVADVADDGWAAAYEAGRARLAAAWADDAKLDMPISVPWGEMPGRAYLASGCVMETVAHTWDLSQALGHPLPLDQELGEYALQWAQQALTADRRGEGVPFGPVRSAPQDADAYGRLAAWLGRTL